MTRTDDQPSERGTTPSRRRSENTYVFSRRARVGATIGLAALAVAAVGLSGRVTDDREGYILVHALAAVPFQLGAIVCARRARSVGPAEFRAFWQSWWKASLVAGLASVVAVAAVVLGLPGLMLVVMLLLLAAAPFWTAAARHMVKAQAGRRDPAVDLIDSVMAVVVLSAPGVLVLVEPVLRSADVMFAGPFALFAVIVPWGIYTSALNLSRVPHDERLTHALGLGVAATFALSMSLQLARVLGDAELPLGVFVGALVLNVSLITALPLWSHRETAGGLARLPVERQVRAGNPMATVSAVVLPAVAVYVLVRRGDDRWAVGYLASVLLAVIVLHALRHALLSREAQRLSGELARMAEERRVLLASMVRALDEDRRRSVSELHTQAVGSLSTLGTIVQTACVSLPTSTAQVVKETIGQLQGDLSDRAEELRLLMLAMRPPSFDGADGTPPDGDDALTAALRAYASELLDETDPARRPLVRVTVDQTLDLDRTTMTIVYRIAQEALLNATRHALATTVDVSVVAGDSAGVVVEVADDGVGFDPGTTDEGSGMATMSLFTDLGRGELTVRSSLGEGTVVRSHLGACRPVDARSVHARPVDGGPVVTGGHDGPLDELDGMADGIPDGMADAIGRAQRPGSAIARRHLRLLPSLGGKAPPLASE
jgi:signal transduction histidine kinase